MRIAIIGGGISGLSCVYRLMEMKKEKGDDLEVSLYEAGPRLGGIIETVKKDGFIIEKGPDSFISDKPYALDLCRRLGIEDKIIRTQEKNRRSFVVRKGSLIPLPEGFYLIAPTQISSFLKTPLFSLSGKLRIMMEPFISAWPIDRDESIGGFIRRRFGKEALERVGQAMVAGIYTGDPENLSLLATMPRFKELESGYGSVVRGLRGEAAKKKQNLKSVSGPRYSLFLSFRDGMETLVDEISKKLPIGTAQLNLPIKEIFQDASSLKWQIIFEDRRKEEADAVCLAVSARRTGSLLRRSLPAIAAQMDKINYESVATINFAFCREDISHPLDGFGFVVPRIENKALIACGFSGKKFEGRAPAGHELLRAFVGGVFGKKYLEMGDKELEVLALKELSEYLGIKGKPLFSVIHRYKDSMVQYRMGHLDLVKEIRTELKEHKGLFMTGSVFRGVGIPDCIADAEAQAEKICELRN